MNEEISAKDYFERGNMSYRQGKYKEAIRDYKKSLKMNPKSYSTWGNMGAAYGKLANSEKAIECYLRSLEI
ncbi:MAG: tetratricopeptide repeat protein, partial [Promethearchaeota archaeon]